jgi:hypothetical protein
MKHIKILISPSGEEWYDAYGPVTKDRAEAIEYYTNPATLAEPSRFGSGQAYWPCEIEAAAIARNEYRGWTFRNEPLTGIAL